MYLSSRCSIVIVTFQVKKWHVQAIGGYFLDDMGSKVYPGVASMLLEGAEGRRTWKEEEKGVRRRDSFLTAQVPRSWIRTIKCFAAN